MKSFFGLHYILFFTLLLLVSLSCSLSPKMQKIKIGFLDPLAYSPFDNKIYRGEIYPRAYDILEKVSTNELHFIRVQNPELADIVIASSTEFIRPYLQKRKINAPRQKYLVWTHEPRLDFNRSKIVTIENTEIHVMNLYNHNVFLNNYYSMQETDHLRRSNFITPITKADLAKKTRNTVLLASFAGKQSLYQSMWVPEDLALLRSNLGLFGYKLGIVDIFGKDWPKGTTKKESQDGTRLTRKNETLKEYKFNLCFENTHIKYYVTEKIWDAIKGYNLPIYYGSDWIYEDFPRDSFIDYTQFHSADELFKYINSMNDDEYVNRLNKCIEVFNRILNLAQQSNVFDKRDHEIKKILVDLGNLL